MRSNPQPKEQSKPEEFASLDHFQPKLNYEGQVAKSCIHCHQVRDAARKEFRNAGDPLPEELMYPFPSGKVFGLGFDKQSRTTIESVSEGSIAFDSGLRQGDILEAIGEQAIHSEADFEWMLHNTPSTETSLAFQISRQDESRKIDVALPEGWRRYTDLSWRPTTWDLRRMTTGGISLEPVDGETRNELNIADGKMALIATHVGKYGDHARARKAGIRNNDIIVSF